MTAPRSEAQPAAVTAGSVKEQSPARTPRLSAGVGESHRTANEHLVANSLAPYIGPMCETDRRAVEARRWFKLSDALV